MDDVLNDLMKVWFQKFRKEHPSCSTLYTDLTVNPPHSILQIGLNEYIQSLDLFRRSQAYRGMVPVPEVKEWFAQNGSRYHHCALTAVPRHAASISAAWVIEHFGEWIRSFHFVPSKRQGETIAPYDRNKKEFLKRHAGFDLFVDDNAENVSAARESGLNTLLFPRPWNNSDISIDGLLTQVAAL